MYSLVSCNLYIYPRNNNEKGIKPLFVTFIRLSWVFFVGAYSAY